MPTLPARVAATAERWFRHPATVTDVEVLSPGLRRVTFAGDALRDRRFTPGQEIEFRVSERDFRHYTPMAFADGVAQVVFTDHGEGPGAAWARALAPGDEVGVLGPGGGLRSPIGGRRLVLGDATTLGLFAALGPDATAGAVEVAPEDAEAAAALVPHLDVVARGPAPGDALHEWVQAHRPVSDHACLAGHAQSIQELRTRLRAAGMPRSAITTKAYWATGKRGL